jgi:DNA-binding CsgD family transcriptional regulator
MTTRANLDTNCLDACMVGQALDGMCVGLIMMNAAGRVDWMNRSALRMLDLKPSQCYGMSLTQVMRDPQLTAFWHKAQDTDGTLMGEVSVRWPKPAELKINATQCLNRVGVPIGRALLFCDVTSERTVNFQLSQDLTERLLEMAEPGHEDRKPHASLTATELKVLRLVGDGLSNQEICEELTVAPSTVRSHLKHVYAKLRLKTRPEAISYAIRHGVSQG